VLYLNPPYFVINGVSVFPDDADSLQFYYLPMMPHFTMVTDAAGASLPQLQLIEYTGSAGSGGFINFDVNLGVAADELSAVAQQVQRQLNLNGQVRLSPVIFVDGSVRLVLLGTQSAEPPPPTGGAASAAAATVTTTTTAAGAAGQPQFVVRIQNAVKPALYGDNQATFSVQLDQSGADLLSQALGGQMAPIAVIYSLDFLGLRPAFNVRITADWNRVQTSLDSQFSGGFLFFSTTIEKTVDKLIESKVISIDESTYTTEADLGTAAGSDRDRAVAECYELVKTNFFESSLQPPDPNKPDDWDKASGAFRNISDMALTGGAAGIASFSYRKTDLSRTDQKSLNFDVSERTTVQRTIYPQGHLSGLLDALTQSGIGLGQFILPVDLDSPFFERRQVVVTTCVDFNGDSIGSIDVTMTYNGVEQAAKLTPTATTANVTWNSLVENHQVSMPVSYTYTVNFKDVDTTQRPGQLTSATLSSVGNIDIEPRGQLYDITVIPVQAFGLPWDRYPSVEVECQYVDAANAINQQPSAILSSQNTEVNWALFLMDSTRRSFNYRLTFALASGGTSKSDWVTTNDATINISDPFPAKITLTILAALDWTVFSEALVFAAYPSKEAPIMQQTYTLTAASPTAPAFIAERQDPTQIFVYFEARLIHINGQVWTIPPSVCSDAYLILQDGKLGHQVLLVQAEAIDFASKQVQEIDVQLRYVDPANSINVTQTVVLSSKGDTRTFAYDYSNLQIAAEYTASIKLTNGRTKTIDWTPASGNTITIPLSQLD
jgi:hypothetical protein